MKKKIKENIKDVVDQVMHEIIYKKAPLSENYKSIEIISIVKEDENLINGEYIYVLDKSIFYWIQHLIPTSILDKIIRLSNQSIFNIKDKKINVKLKTIDCSLLKIEFNVEFFDNVVNIEIIEYSITYDVEIPSWINKSIKSRVIENIETEIINGIKYVKRDHY